MFKTFSYSWKVLQLAWKSNKFLAVIVLFANVYENTLFPFFQVFILAQVLNIIQKTHMVQLSQLIPYAGLYVLAAVIKTVLTSYANFNQVLFDTHFETYLDRLIIKKLTTLDPQTFEKPEFQNLLAQIEGTKGTMTAQLDRITGFINAIAKVLTAVFVLLPAFPIFIPLVLVSVIPSYYLGDVTRKKLWPFFSSKRSVLLRVTEYVKNLLSQENTSKLNFDSTASKIFNVGTNLIIDFLKTFLVSYVYVRASFTSKKSQWYV